MQDDIVHGADSGRLHLHLYLTPLPSAAPDRQSPISAGVSDPSLEPAVTSTDESTSDEADSPSALPGISSISESRSAERTMPAEQWQCSSDASMGAEEQAHRPVAHHSLTAGADGPPNGADSSPDA